MDYGLTKTHAGETGRYGLGWVLAELLLFLVGIVLTGGGLFLMLLFKNLSTGSDQFAYPWEYRNHANNVCYSSTLKGRMELLVERVAAKFSKAFSRG